MLTRKEPIERGLLRIRYAIDVVRKPPNGHRAKYDFLRLPVARLSSESWCATSIDEQIVGGRRFVRKRQVDLELSSRQMRERSHSQSSTIIWNGELGEHPQHVRAR